MLGSANVWNSTQLAGCVSLPATRYGTRSVGRNRSLGRWLVPKGNRPLTQGST